MITQEIGQEKNEVVEYNYWNTLVKTREVRYENEIEEVNL